MIDTGIRGNDKSSAPGRNSPASGITTGKKRWDDFVKRKICREFQKNQLGRGGKRFSVVPGPPRRVTKSSCKNDEEIERIQRGRAKDQAASHARGQENFHSAAFCKSARRSTEDPKTLLFDACGYQNHHRLGLVHKHSRALIKGGKMKREDLHWRRKGGEGKKILSERGLSKWGKKRPLRGGEKEIN